MTTTTCAASIKNPLSGLVPGNTQGIYTSSNTSRQTLLSPFPAFGSSAINTTENTGYSWYHSLQFSLQKRFSQGLHGAGQLHVLEVDAGGEPAERRRIPPVREISDADAPHRINISGVWELPFGKGKHLLAARTAS